MKRIICATLAAFSSLYLAIPASAAGSLAVNKHDPEHYGWAVDRESYHESDRVALSYCTGECTIVYRFEHTCAAFASQRRPDGATGWAHRDSAEEAKEAAVKECERYADHCEVKVWGCDK